MNSYSLKPNTLFQLFGQSFVHYGKTFKAIYPSIILSTIVQEALLYLRGLQFSQIVRLTIYTIIILIIAYIWSVALYRTDLALKGEPVPFKTANRWICNKISSIYMGVFAFVLGVVALFFIGYVISHLVDMFVGNNQTLRAVLPMFLIGMPLAFFLVLFYYVLPLLILEPINLWPAFRKSAKLVGTSMGWLRTFAVYAITSLLIMVFIPQAQHNIWLKVHHVSFLFDLVVLSLAGPVIINLVLLLLNDLRLRRHVTS